MADPALNIKDHVASIPGATGNAGQPLTDKYEERLASLERNNRYLSESLTSAASLSSRANRRSARLERRLDKVTESLRWTQFALVVLAVGDIVWVVAT